MPALPTVLRPIALATVSALLAAACTAGDGSEAVDDPVAGPTATEPGPTPASESPTPTPTTTTTPTPSASPTSVSRVPLAERLMPASLLPGFNDEFTWTARDTIANGEGEDFAVMCQKFALTSIGATKVARRDYAPAVESPAGASEVVAQFPDAQTARSAYSVLRSWHAKCPEDHDGNLRVSAFQEVGLADGSGGWYLLTYGSTFRAQGIAVRGTRIALVVLTTEGEDYNYEPGQEPMVEALARASALV